MEDTGIQQVDATNVQNQDVEENAESEEIDVCEQQAKVINSTLSVKGDQECPGHDFLMSRSAVRYVSSKSKA